MMDAYSEKLRSESAAVKEINSKKSSVDMATVRAFLDQVNILSDRATGKLRIISMEKRTYDIGMDSYDQVTRTRQLSYATMVLEIKDDQSLNIMITPKYDYITLNNGFSWPTTSVVNGYIQYKVLSMKKNKLVLVEQILADRLKPNGKIAQNTLELKIIENSDKTSTLKLTYRNGQDIQAAR